MNDALRNSLVIEMSDLLAEGEILERGTALPRFQRILIVRNDDALIGREGPPRRLSGLMRGPSRIRRRYGSGSLSFSKPFVLLVFAIRSAPSNDLLTATPAKRFVRVHPPISDLTIESRRGT